MRKLGSKASRLGLGNPITPKERDQISQAAKVEGLTTGSWVRQVLLKNALAVYDGYSAITGEAL